MKKKNQPRQRGSKKNLQLSAAVGAQSSVGAGKWTHNADGTASFCHREYVADIFTDTGNIFAYDVFSLNPNDPNTFPYLAAMASRWESFRFKRLSVETEPLVGSTTTGSILLEVDYDSNDNVNNSTKTELYNSVGKGNPLWSPNKLVCPTSDLNRVGPWRFVQQDSDVDQTAPDLRLQSAGNLFVATTASNASPGSAVAELFIDYCIEFKTPVLHANTDFSYASYHNQRVGTGGATTNVLQAFGVSQTPYNDYNGQARALISLGNQVVQYVQQPASGSAAGLGGLISGAATWATAGGTDVSAQPIIKFVRDFVGTLVISAVNTTANNLPDFSSVSLTPVYPSGNNIVERGPNVFEFLENVAENVANAPGSGSFGFLDVAIAAAKGTGLYITAPSFVPNLSQFNVALYPTPVSLAAFRARIRAKKGLVTDGVLRRKTRWISENDTVASTSSASTTPSSNDSLEPKPDPFGFHLMEIRRHLGELPETDRADALRKLRSS
jgi:hypothetical protein